MHALTRKNALFHWSEDCQAAFDQLKVRLTTSPITAFPDFSKEFRLYTDASTAGLGAILAQIRDGKESIICCASRALNKAEKSYPATKLECLAIVWAVAKFRPYLMAMPFEVYTDHYALQWLKTMRTCSSTAGPWPWRSTTSLCGIGLGKFRPMWTGSVAFQLVQLYQRTLYCIYRWKMRRKLAAWHRSSTQPHISGVKPCGSYSATAIPTRLAAASALRWPRVAHSAREGVTMAIARKPREPLSLGDRGTLSLWTLWVHSLPTADTSSSSCLWIASRGTLCLYLLAIIPQTR